MTRRRSSLTQMCHMQIDGLEMEQEALQRLNKLAAKGDIDLGMSILPMLIMQALTLICVLMSLNGLSR